MFVKISGYEKPVIGERSWALLRNSLLLTRATMFILTILASKVIPENCLQFWKDEIRRDDPHEKLVKFLTFGLCGETIEDRRKKRARSVWLNTEPNTSPRDGEI